MSHITGNHNSVSKAHVSAVSRHWVNFDQCSIALSQSPTMTWKNGQNGQKEFAPTQSLGKVNSYCLQVCRSRCASAYSPHTEHLCSGLRMLKVNSESLRIYGDCKKKNTGIKHMQLYYLFFKESRDRLDCSFFTINLTCIFREVFWLIFQVISNFSHWTEKAQKMINILPYLIISAKCGSELMKFRPLAW